MEIDGNTFLHTSWCTLARICQLMNKSKKTVHSLFMPFCSERAAGKKFRKQRRPKTATKMCVIWSSSEPDAYEGGTGTIQSVPGNGTTQNVHHNPLEKAKVVFKKSTWFSQGKDSEVICKFFYLVFYRKLRKEEKHAKTILPF